jgi:lysophospholipase L1-like esterase
MQRKTPFACSDCRSPKLLLPLMLLLLTAQVFSAEQTENASTSYELKEGAKSAIQVAESKTARAPEKESFEHYIRKSVVPRQILDQWLRNPGWTTFDSELGYVLGNSLMPWGIDNSATIETIDTIGARRSIMYSDRKSRINTYGDSFTECNQVSDGETWQEYLAAHLGEPIRNFGVGGYGVYQAYRRMLREEETDHAAKYVILTICCDDSTRSLLRYRRALFFAGWPEYGGTTFHGNFWSNLEMDLDTGRFVEREQLLTTKDSLYRMTEPQWMIEHLKDDLALQLELYSYGLITDLDRGKISKLASALDFPFNWDAESKVDPRSSPQTEGASPRMSPMQIQAAALLNRYSQRATIFILGKAQTFTRKNSKHLLIVLNSNVDIGEMKQQGTRADQELVNYLMDENIPFVDMNEIFLRGLRKSNLSADDYMAPYLVNGAGHFNPTGNHFIAYAIKEKLIKLLEPKPVPYQKPNEQVINFRGYLRGGMYR